MQSRNCKYGNISEMPDTVVVTKDG